MKLKDLITGKEAIFDEFHGGCLFYKIGDFRFPVLVEELNGARISSKEKASTFMKWVKRALKKIEEGEKNEDSK